LEVWAEEGGEGAVSVGVLLGMLWVLEVSVE
jgi:hypothetical protein